MRIARRRLNGIWQGLRQPGRIAVAAALLVLADHLFNRSGGSFVPGGPFDETAHVATAWLILQALPRSVRERFLWPAIVGSFVIDIDHIPGALGYDFLTRGTPRPYSHSLLTPLVLVLGGLLWKRRRDLLWGLGLGVILHFIRDLAEGNGNGIPLLWPLTDRAASYAHALYLALMAVVVAFDLGRWALAARSGTLVNHDPGREKRPGDAFPSQR